MKPSWKQLLPACLVSLVLGAAISCFGMRAAMRHFRYDSARMFELISRELALDAGQKAAVKTILDANSLKLKALREETRGRFDALRQSMHAEIKKVLSAEQQAKFDAIVAKHEERRKKRREMMQR